ncbi:MAG: CHAP domain-containing protein [Solobacterium sp.]|nr:CHAP domain-containing protein [Solobacterium sp.]
MSKFRKTVTFLCSLSMIIGLQPAVNVEAEPEYTDSAYWNMQCMNQDSLSEEQQASCQAYADFIEQRNKELTVKLSELDSSKQGISATIDSYTAKSAEYSAQIDGLSSMMDDLNMQIGGANKQSDELLIQIKDSEEQIELEKAQIESLKQRMKNRMSANQGTMRLNQFLDVLMGAQSFSDFVRIAGGLSDIYEYDSTILEEMNESYVKLNEMQEELLSEQNDLKVVQMNLESGKSLLNAQQSALVASKDELSALQLQYQEQLKNADSQTVQIIEEMNQNTAVLDNVKNSIALSYEKTKPKSTPTPTPAAGDDNGNSDGGSGSPDWYTDGSGAPVTGGGSNPYYGGWGNCTWGAWQLVYDTLGIALPGWGMAGDWLWYAQRDGYPTGSEPAVYSVAVYVGHVAFVTEVGDGMVYIKEGNYMGQYYERWVPLDALPYTGQTCLGYIYLQ